MKKWWLVFLGLGLITVLAVNTKSIRRDIRRLHWFDSETLLKTSSFDRYTVDVFQEGDQVRIEVYSSYDWFED